MKPHKIRIAYLYNICNTFVKIDEEILERRYRVRSLYVRERSLKFLAELWQVINEADIVVAWFASWHSLAGFVLALLQRKPRVLITGGYDVASEPEIEYGLRRGGLPYVISEFAFRLTSLALPISETAYQETLANTPLKAERTQLVVLGVRDSVDFQQPHPKEDIVLTIGRIHQVSVRRKGIMEFVKSAQYLPDFRFVVVGQHLDESIDELRQVATPNVEFTGFLADDDLVRLLQRASVYVQPSHHEGFGLAVAESMLARCVPLVSRRGSLPEVVGDAGVYLDDTEPHTIADGIKAALHLKGTLGEKARQRIIEHFSIEQRARGLYDAIERVSSDVGAQRSRFMERRGSKSNPRARSGRKPPGHEMAIQNL